MCDGFISLSCEMLMWLVIISGCKVWDLGQDRMEWFLYLLCTILDYKNLKL